MRQTAVEWLDSQLDFLHKYMSECNRINLFDQAKEMEKQQITEAYIQGSISLTAKTQAEQYYNETFKK
jgi:hypothetical protein